MSRNNVKLLGALILTVISLTIIHRFDESTYHSFLWASIGAWSPIMLFFIFVVIPERITTFIFRRRSQCKTIWW